MNEMDRAYEKALCLLEKQDLTVLQLRQRLEKAGFCEEVLETTVLQLTEAGYLDDERYAVRYMEALAAKGRGRLRMAAEMRRKGLDEALVRNTLEDGTDAALEYARASAEAMRMLEPYILAVSHQAAEKAEGTEDGAEAEACLNAARKAVEKVGRRLATRGFSWETIGGVMTAVRRRLAEAAQGTLIEFDEGESDV